MSRSTRPGARGQGLTEFAVVFPLFILLVLVVIDFGRGIYAYHTISNAARGGARVAIVDQNPTRVRATALEETVGLNPDDIDVDLSQLTTSCGTLKIGCETAVTVSYAFRPLAPLVGTIFGPMTLSSTTRIPIERVHTSSP